VWRDLEARCGGPVTGSMNIEDACFVDGIDADEPGETRLVDMGGYLR